MVERFFVGASIAVGIFVQYLGIAAQITARGVGEWITGLSMSLASAVLVLLPVYSRFRNEKRKQDVADIEAHASDLTRRLEESKQEALSLRARLAEMGNEVSSIQKDRDSWRTLYLDRTSSSLPSPPIKGQT